MPTIDVNGAKQAGYSDQEINDFVKGNPSIQRSDQGAFNSAITKTSVGDALSGLSGPLGQLVKPLINNLPGAGSSVGDIPFVGGMLRNAAKAGEFVAEPTAGTAMNMWNVANQMQNKGQNTASPEQLKSLGNRQFMSQDDFNDVTQNGPGNALLHGAKVGALAAAPLAFGPEAGIVEQGVGGAAGGFAGNPSDDLGSLMASTGLGLAGGMAFGAAKGLPKYMTQGGLNKAMTAAKDASVARGESATGEGFFNSVDEALQRDDPYGMKSDLRDAVQSELSKLPDLSSTVGEPGTAEGINTQQIGQKALNADWFHSLRKTLDEKINWARQNNSPVDEKAAKLIRQAASDQLHTMAPETKLLDTLNHLYYNPLIKGGKIPFTSINAKYPAALTGVPSAAINAILATLGVGEAKHILGK